MITISLIMMVPLRKRIHQDDNTFQPDTSLISRNSHDQTNTTSVVENPSTSVNYKDSEDENLQLQFIHESYPTVKKPSLKDSLLEPSFFRPASKFRGYFLLPETPSNIETLTEISRRDPVYKWITRNSRPVTKTFNISASPFLME